MGLDYGLAVPDIRKVVQSNKDAPVMKAIILGLMEGIEQIDFLCEGNYNQFLTQSVYQRLDNFLPISIFIIVFISIGTAD